MQNATVSIQDTKQKYLKENGLIVLICLLTAAIPLSIDIYLPAMPTMGKALNDTNGLIHLTLEGFFMSFGIFTLLMGPISDKFGRKPILIIGLISYIIGSLLCAFAPNVELLILFRVIQSIGCGAIVAITGAIVKDAFDGEKRKNVMAIVQSCAMVAPLVAPVIGAFLLGFTSWRGIFIFLTVIGILALILTLFYEETLEEKSEESSIKVFSRLIHVLRNPNISLLMVVFLLAQIGTMAYVSKAAYIYIENFKLSEKAFSGFFSGNAIFSIIGPLILIKISKSIKTDKLVKFSLLVLTLTGVLVINFGMINPLVFALTVIPFTFFAGMIRPLGANLMFDQEKNDAGSVSSLFNFFGVIAGTIGMRLMSVNLFGIGNIKMLGSIYIITSIISLGVWFMINKRICK